MYIMHRFSFFKYMYWLKINRDIHYKVINIIIILKKKTHTIFELLFVKL